ncbi:hypothetical protein [Segeticoccus rhizosphaerae]|jgi:hypothetical protein|uniref:hypothetical protein n=1 Tax=Segeticoccus rhizosphaerae TaxID=1104777 RepID=UPI001396B4C9|nr:hypothetical protein [Segeticoccus rhizosphaerae]
MTTTTTTTLRAEARTEAFWLRLTLVSIALAILGLLIMGLSMLFGTPHDDNFRASDYMLTSAALPQGVGLFLATLGFHRLQRGQDGKLGTAGIWVYGVCMVELVIECMASVVAGSELIWGPLYPLCAFGLMIGLALLAAGSWKVGLLPKWMLGVWPPLGLIGSFFGIGPIPLVFMAFLALLAMVLPQRLRNWTT